MTANQKLAADLAEGVLAGRVDPAGLPDLHWQLLLLAAGDNCANARPAVVAGRVMRHFHDRSGYFADAGSTDGVSSMLFGERHHRQDAGTAVL